MLTYQNDDFLIECTMKLSKNKIDELCDKYAIRNTECNHILINHLFSIAVCTLLEYEKDAIESTAIKKLDDAAAFTLMMLDIKKENLLDSLIEKIGIFYELDRF